MPRLVKNWLQAYLQYTKNSEAPEVFHFWTGVSTIAGALQRRVFIYQDSFEWTPNFYIIFVAPAGIATKSTTIQIGMDLLGEIEGVHFGPASCTWQALAQKLENAQTMLPKEPGNIEGEMVPMSCVTCAVSELGTFMQFQDDKMMSVLIDLWDGKKGTFEHATRTQGSISIQNPWINIIAGTTPSWLKANAPDTLIGGGFTSRVIFVYGDAKRHYIAYPGLIRDAATKDKERAVLVHDLEQIASLQGEYRISPEVAVAGQEWYEHHWSHTDIHMASDRYGGYRARKQTHIHKLAMVFAAARHDLMWIELEDFNNAVKMMEAVEIDMTKVFESIGVNPTNKLMVEMLNFLMVYQQQNIAVNRQMLWRHCVQFMSIQEFQEVQRAAVDAGYLQIKEHQGDFYYLVLVDPRSINSKDTKDSKDTKNSQVA